jgi:hypothetical protein
MDTLEDFAEEYGRDPAAIIAQIGPDIAWPADPDFVVGFQPAAFGVYEVKTGIFIRLGP